MGRIIATKLRRILIGRRALRNGFVETKIFKQGGLFTTEGRNENFWQGITLSGQDEAVPDAP